MPESVSGTGNCNGYILVVEDSLVQAEVLTALLEDNGYQVKKAENGRIAFEMACLEPPMLVVSDIMMPEMDGFELTRKIRNDTVLAPVPILLLTSLTDVSDVVRALFCGADTFVSKPYEDKFLLNQISLLLEKKREKEKNDEEIIPFTFVYEGEKYEVTASREKIIEFLLTTYELAIERNKALDRTKNELYDLNARLEERVAERTNELKKLNEELKADKEKIAATERELREQYSVLVEQESLIRESEYKFHEIFDNINEAVFLYELMPDNSRGYLIEVNDVACRRLRYSREELLRLTFQDITPVLKKKANQAMILTLKTEKESSFDAEQVRKDGSVFPVHVNARMIELRDHLLVISLVRDLTEEHEARKREAVALRQIEENLTQLAILNDEIRNPLAVITGVIGLNEDETTNAVLEQVQMINDLVTRLDKGWLESEKIREYLRKYHDISY